MMLLALDPGPEQSAYVMWDGERVRAHGILSNADCLLLQADHRVIEMIASYGMPVGREVFETCVWVGRYIEAWGGADRLYRRDVKLHCCGDPRAKDGNVRQYVIDRLGAPGVKKQQGVTYGLKADEWQALALALTWWDRRFPVRGVLTQQAMGVPF